MERKMLEKLNEWKNSKNRMPLIINGARQVGKTYSLLSFGKEQYKNIAYINFEDNKEAIKIFEKDFNIERIILELSVTLGVTILKGDTLIILDEIQACERALTSLKYFCENGSEYHVCAAGSLLGVAINREKYSFPVGKVSIFTLYPLDFEEFLWAINEKELANLIRKHYINNEEFALHEKAMELYRLYLVVGGMPKSILEYLDKKDMNFVNSILKDINNSYIADMAKYATPTETTKLLAVYSTISSQLAKEYKKFQYKLIKSGARAYEYENSLNWLNASGIINKCIKVKEGKLPLSAYMEADSFKIYMTDVALLCNKFAIPVYTVLTNNENLNNFKGALTENYVCSSLIFAGIIPYYWESDGKAEVDFVVQDKYGNIIPIEVKSSENVRAKSLKIFIDKYNIKYSIRISSKNFGLDNNIKSVPLYAVFCLEEIR